MLIETKTYTAGTRATGAAPMPDLSPRQQEFLGMLDDVLESLRRGRVALEWSNQLDQAANVVRSMDQVREAITQIKCKPEQPAAAGVSDAEIRRAWYDCGVGKDFDVPPSEDDMRFARAILALRPQAVPMTDEPNAYKQAEGSKNCMQCAAAYMIGIPLTSVPDFEQAGPNAWELFESFFRGHGFTAEMFPPSVEIVGDYLASGDTERGTSHMVVMRGGKLLHDPHPSNAGLKSVQVVWLITRRAHGITAQGAQGEQG